MTTENLFKGDQVNLSMYASMLLASLFTTAMIWNLPMSLIREGWIENTCNLHAMDFTSHREMK